MLKFQHAGNFYFVVIAFGILGFLYFFVYLPTSFVASSRIYSFSPFSSVPFSHPPLFPLLLFFFLSSFYYLPSCIIFPFSFSLSVFLSRVGFRVSCSVLDWGFGCLVNTRTVMPFNCQIFLWCPMRRFASFHFLLHRSVFRKSTYTGLFTNVYTVILQIGFSTNLVI